LANCPINQGDRILTHRSLIFETNTKIWKFSFQ
jgi:hypothetical protein